MASSQMDKLETIFEERVAKALKSMGLPSAEDVAALQARVEQLEKQLTERKS
jgi:poly(hydroxyalkanoate) granule-associated protein